MTNDNDKSGAQYPLSDGRDNRNAQVYSVWSDDGHDLEQQTVMWVRLIAMSQLFNDKSAAQYPSSDGRNNRNAQVSSVWSDDGHDWE